MKARPNVQKITLIVLSVLLIAAVGVALGQNRRAQALADTADAALRRALYESAELLGGLQGSLCKLPASSSAAQEQLILSDIARQAFGVQENLSVLPSDAHDLQGALKFVNQIQDYAAVLTLQLAEGGTISENDQAQLSSLAVSAQDLQIQLLSSAESLSPIRFSPPESTNGTGEQAPSVEYPSLIYDGPFSDGAKSGPIPAQGGDLIDIDKAQQAAADFVGGDRVRSVRCVGEISLPTECYEFEIETGSEMLTLCITKTGGHVLYMMTDAISAQEKISEGAAIDSAHAFLRSRGYGDMQPTYWSHADGFLTVNFAALQDHVLLYPDLVKVQVSLESGNVTGIEALNYLTNHVPRVIEAPAVSLEEAQDMLSDRLNVTGSRLCIIPTDPGEALVWEFSADIEGVGSYLVYIDAATGFERRILRLVETESGLETQ